MAPNTELETSVVCPAGCNCLLCDTVTFDEEEENVAISNKSLPVFVGKKKAAYEYHQNNKNNNSNDDNGNNNSSFESDSSSSSSEGEVEVLNDPILSSASLLNDFDEDNFFAAHNNGANDDDDDDDEEELADENDFDIEELLIKGGSSSTTSSSVAFRSSTISSSSHQNNIHSIYGGARFPLAQQQQQQPQQQQQQAGIDFPKIVNAVAGNGDKVLQWKSGKSDGVPLQRSQTITFHARRNKVEPTTLSVYLHRWGVTNTRGAPLPAQVQTAFQPFVNGSSLRFSMPSVFQMFAKMELEDDVEESN